MSERKNIPGVPPRWTPEEIKDTRAMFECATPVPMICDIINQKHRSGRTPFAISAMMRKIGAKFGGVLSPEAMEATAPDYVRMRKAGRLGGIARALAFEDSQRPQPWHPARDPKPAFLQRPIHQRRHHS